MPAGLFHEKQVLIHRYLYPSSHKFCICLAYFSASYSKNQLRLILWWAYAFTSKTKTFVYFETTATSFVSWRANKTIVVSTSSWLHSFTLSWSSWNLYILSPAVTINDKLICCQRIIKIDNEITVMEIEKTLVNDPLSVSKVFWKFRIPATYNFAVIYPWSLHIFIKSSLPFNSFYCLFSL